MEIAADIRPSLVALRERGIRLGIVCDVGDLRRTDIAGASAIGMRTVRYRALHDDPAIDGAIEADFVLDSHRELPLLVDRIGRPRG